MQYWCSLWWNVVVTLYSDLTFKVIIKVFPQKNNTKWPCWHLESFFRSTSTNKVLLTEILNLKTFSWMLMVRAKSGLCYWNISWDSVSNHDPLQRPNAFMLSTYLLQETISRVFNKILSRWQKLWSRWRGKKLVTKVQFASAEGPSFWKNCEIWAS